jgi:hypothetical protein
MEDNYELLIKSYFAKEKENLKLKEEIDGIRTNKPSGGDMLNRNNSHFIEHSPFEQTVNISTEIDGNNLYKLMNSGSMHVPDFSEYLSNKTSCSSNFDIGSTNVSYFILRKAKK